MQTNHRRPPEQLIRECLDWAAHDQATHNLIIGLLERALREADFRGKLYLAAARRAGEIAALAVRSDFPKLSVSATRSDEVMAELASQVEQDMPDLPCAMGPAREARLFADAWTARTGFAAAQGRPQRIYRLRQVTAPPPVQGSLRLARTPDIDLVMRWMAAFEEDLEEARSETGRLQELATRLVDEEAIFLWQDGAQTLSLVGARGPRGLVARIGPVYTPPPRRRRGYASAAVAAASRLMLSRGHPLCCLYTDRRNTTANHIYQEIGYQPVCDVEEFWFSTLPGSVPGTGS